MPFLLALVPAFEALGIAAGTATSLIVPDLLVPDSPNRTGSLLIRGRIFGFGERSTHVMSPDTDGAVKNMGSIWYTREMITADELRKMVGLPILAPDLHTRIGTVHRAWVENDAVLFSGEIRDSDAARHSLTVQKCGVCLEYGNVRQNGSGAYEGELKNLRICLQGQSGFNSSRVTFEDRTIRLEDTGRPRAIPFEWHVGYGW